MRKLCVAVILVCLLTQPQASAKELVATRGNFDIYLNIDPITDMDRSFASTLSEDQDSVLFLQCESDGLNVDFKFIDHYYAHDIEFDVIYRFDKQKAINSTWQNYSDDEFITLDMDEVEDFISSAKVSKQLLLRSIDSNNASITSTFNLKGLSQALELLSCYK